MPAKPADLCSCCRRIIRSNEPEGKCWECRGAPADGKYHHPPAGKRDPTCTHDTAGVL